MKKITCFISSLASGGAEHQMAILASLLSDHSLDVTLVTCLDEPDGYDVSPMVKRVKLRSRKGHWGPALESFKYFLQVKTDCIISFRERMNLVVLISALFRKKIKVIAGERNLTVGPPSWTGKINQLLLYNRADHIVTNSYSQASYLRNLRKKWENKVCTIINYTDLDVYKPSPEPESDQILIIGVFARFSPQKNCTRFIQMTSLLKKQTSKKFKVIWLGHRLGEANELYYNSFIENLRRYDVEDVIEVHEPVRNVNEWMSRFHAICLPSLFEGFSNSISEGICSGKPMLVSNVSDNCLMVKDSFNGFTFNPLSIEEMLSAFIRFFGLNKKERETMGRNSRLLAEQLFDKRRFVGDYLKLIEG